jgi:hypothetical protein
VFLTCLGLHRFQPPVVCFAKIHVPNIAVLWDKHK